MKDEVKAKLGAPPVVGYLVLVMPMVTTVASIILFLLLSLAPMLLPGTERH